MAPMGATELAAEAAGGAVGEVAGVDAGDGELMAAGSMAAGAGVGGNGSTGPAGNILR